MTPTERAEKIIQALDCDFCSTYCKHMNQTEMIAAEIEAYGKMVLNRHYMPDGPGCAGLDRARAEERSACAKIANNLSEKYLSDGKTAEAAGAAICAEDIRSRTT